MVNRVIMTVSLPFEELSLLEELCKKTGKTRSKIISELIKEASKNQEKK